MTDTTKLYTQIVNNRNTISAPSKQDVGNKAPQVEEPIDVSFDNCMKNIEEINDMIAQSQRDRLFDSMSDDGHQVLQDAAGQLNNIREQCSGVIEKANQGIDEAKKTGGDTSPFEVVLTKIEPMEGMLGAALITLQNIAVQSDHIMLSASVTSAQTSDLTDEQSIMGELTQLTNLLTANLTISDIQDKKDHSKNGDTVPPNKTLNDYTRNGNGNIRISNADAFKGTVFEKLLRNIDGKEAEIPKDDFRKCVNDLVARYLKKCDDPSTVKYLDNYADILLGSTSTLMQTQTDRQTNTQATLNAKQSQKPDAIAQVGEKVNELFARLRAFLDAILAR